MIDITPDWSMVRTAAQSEDEFANFKFEGPGWYVHSADSAGNCQTMLAIPLTETDSSPTNPEELWKQSWPPETQFLFLSYSTPPFASFNAVANAPMRSDGRTG